MVVLLFIFSFTCLNAQVRTTILGEGQKISTLMPGYTPDQPDAKILPKVNVRKVLEEDRKRGSQLPRFRVKIPVGYAVQDGQWYEQGRTAVWKMKFYSRHATALSFQFTDLHLPEGSEMWLYSEARNMVMGPILPEYVHNGILPTDQIFGEEATVVVIMPREWKDKFSIMVGNVIHGIKKAELGVRGYGDFENCNIDIVCSPQGDNWQVEKEAEIVRIRARNTCGWSWQQETYWTVEDHCSLLVEEDNGNEIRDLTDRVEVAPNVRLRPTLAQNEVHIDWQDGYHGGKFKVSVLDRSGRMVKTSDKMQSNQFALSIRDLSAGMYFSGLNMRVLFYGDDLLSYSKIMDHEEA